MKSLNILHRCLLDTASRDLTRDYIIKSNNSLKISGLKLLEDENDLESIFRCQLS
jgi:hypothetical protein